MFQKLNFFRKKKHLPFDVPKKISISRTPQKTSISRMPAVKRRFTQFVYSHSLIITVLICMVGLIGVYVSPLLRVQNISIIRNSFSIDVSSLQSIIAKKAQGKSMMTLSPSMLEKEVQHLFPEWKEVHITKSYPRTLVVTIETFKNFATVIIPSQSLSPFISQELKKKLDSSKNTAQEEKYIINERGAVSLPELGQNPQLLIKYSDPLLVPNVEQGSFLILPKDMEKIQHMLSLLLKYHNFIPKEILFFPDAHEAHVNVLQFTLWFDLRQDIEKQMQKLAKGLSLVDKNNIEYFDLRIANRLIYKEKFSAKKKR